MQEPERALAMYRDAMELGSLTAAIFERIARTHAAMHHYRRAIAEYAKAARLRPDDSSLRLAKIDLFITTGDLQRASAEVDACASLLQVRTRLCMHLSDLLATAQAPRDQNHRSELSWVSP